MKNKDVENDKNKNLSMCYDKWFKIKIKGKKTNRKYQVLLIEQSESWKSLKMYFFSTSKKRLVKERYCQDADLV